MTLKLIFTPFLLLCLSIGTVQAVMPQPIQSTECLQDTQIDNIACGKNEDGFGKTVLYRKGPGKNNVVQGLTLVVNKRILYSLHVTGKPEMGALNRFTDIDGRNTLIALDYQTPSPMIGHQGITNIPDTDWLLSSAGEGVENKGWYISMFKYAPYAPPTSLSTIRIFGDGYSKTTSSMPMVTPNANHLLIRSRKGGHNVIRIYDFKKLDLAIMDDISNESHSEWQIDDDLTKDKYFFQAMTADNKYVYLLSGLSGEEHKRLYIYTMSGKLITKVNDVTIGENDAIQSGSEEHWEPEGLTVDTKTNELYLLFAIGDKGKRLGNIYKIKIHN